MMMRLVLPRSTSKAASAHHLVEFAVVVPIFITFVFGITEIGRGMMVTSLMSNAARVGCRTGIITGNTDTQVNSAIDTLLSAQGISGYTTTIKVNGSVANSSTAVTNDTVQVTVSIPATSASWLPNLSFLSNNLSGQYSLPHE